MNIDQFLAGPAEPNPNETTGSLPDAGGESDVAAFLMGDEETRRLKLAVQQGAQRSPLEAQRVLRMQLKTGLPKEYLAGNLDFVEAEAQSQQFDAERYRKTSPAFASWLAEHPDHAAAASEDLTKLNYLERQIRNIGAQFESNQLTVELEGIGQRALEGTATAADRQRQAVIERRRQEIEELGKHLDITGLLERAPGLVAGQLPILKETLGAKVEGAGEGALIGAAAGATAGAATAQPLLPAAGAALGALSGWRYAAGIRAGQMEMRLALLDYEKLKGEDGLPLDRATVVGLAGIVGVVNGALEGLTGVEALANKLPGVRALSRDGIKELLQTPTSRAVLLTYAKQVGDTMVTEGVTEGLQSMVTSAGGVLAKAIKDGGGPLELLGQIFSPEHVSQAIEEAKAGGVAGGGIATGLAAPAAILDLQRAKQAQRMGEAFQSIGTVAADTKLREALPGTLRAIIESATKDGPVETLYVPTEAFQSYFQSQGADPREVAKALTGDADAYDLAVQTGQDLAIKTADYAEKIAPTEHNKFFAREVRPGLGMMNAREADEWIQQRIEDEAAAEQQAAMEGKQDPLLAVRTAIAGQLQAAGFDPAVVDQYAQLFESRYRARVERRGLGENPLQLFEQAGLNIQRTLPAVLAQLGNKTSELDALINRLRTGDLPKPGDIYGKSLFEAIREKGGMQDQGGEISALGVDEARQPFVKKLIQESGLPIDRMAELMAEAGYAERDQQAFLEAIGREAAGRPVYVPGAENLQLFDLNQQLTELAQYLRELGVNLETTGNEAVKQLLSRAAQTSAAAPEGGQTFEQIGEPTVVLTGRELGDFGDDRKAWRKAGLAAYKRLQHGPPAEHPELGEIRFTRPGAGKMIMTGARIVKWQMVPALPDIIAHGKLQATAVVEGRRADGAVAFHWLETVVAVGDRIYEVGVQVAEDAQGRKFYNLNEDLQAWREKYQAPGGADEIKYRSQRPGGGAGPEGAGPTFQQSILPDRDGVNLHILAQSGGATYQQTAPTAPSFYSKLERVVADKMSPKMKPDELRRMLIANGVKDEELKWSGLDDFFKGKESVTKADVQQFLENNRVEIKVVVLGEQGIDEEVFYQKYDEEIAELQALGWNATVDPGNTQRLGFFERGQGEDGEDDLIGDIYLAMDLPRGRARNLALQLERVVAQDNAGAPKFAQYTAPGGTHYREILLTLPSTTTLIQPEAIKVTRTSTGWRVVSPDGRQVTKIPLRLEGGEVDEAAARQFGAQIFNSGKGGKDEFTQGHYQVPNVLAHVRVDDRVDDEGRKVLFVEEIQSDWHQKGRKQGYHVGKPTADEIAIVREGNEYRAMVRGVWIASGPTEAEAMRTAIVELPTLDDERLQGGVPDAPFKKTWHELALKYLLRHAAEGGYDVLAWTTGAMQAERYDLSKQVEEIHYAQNSDGTFHLWVKPIGQSLVDHIGETNLSAVPAEGLDDIVGKDLAEKIRGGFSTEGAPAPTEVDMERAIGGRRVGQMIHWNDGSASEYDSAEVAQREVVRLYRDKMGLEGEAGTKTISGVDLKIGGSGMKGFYDKIVPTYLNKYGKKWGAKVQRVEVGPKPEADFVIEEQGDGTFGVWDKDSRAHGDPPREEFDTREQAEQWVINHAPRLRPVFRPISDLEWDGLAGASSWTNGDRPLIAETKVKIAEKIYRVQVVLGQEGPAITGVDPDAETEQDETFEYFAPRDAGDVFRHVRWDDADTARRAVEAMWADPESYLWRGMVPISGMGNLDAADRDRIGPVADDGSDVMKVQGLPITEPMKESVLKAGQPLFQSGGKDAKGQITFGRGRIDIALLERADLSTFIHETGHLYLNELVDDALTPGVPQQLRDDLDAVLKWMGLEVRVASGREAIVAAIGRDQHEQFARGFEAYALEGRSPSQAMREVFAKFRQWLIHVYRLMTFRGGATPANIGEALNVKLSADVRKVMNRMVATEEEITAMEREAEILPMFTDAVSAGMTDREFANYRDLVARAGLTAREKLQAQLMAQLARERASWWAEEREKVRAQVTAEANQHRDYIAISVLQKGVMPDGAPLPEGIAAAKLIRRGVAQLLGQDFVKQLPRGVTADQGISPEQAAQLFGYDSAVEFLTAIANARPKQALIEAETDHRMTREYGDPLVDGTLHDKAQAAVLNEDREKIVEAELAALNKKRREVSPFLKAQAADLKAKDKEGRTVLAALTPPLDAVRDLARRQIARYRVREIKPQVHFIAAQKASRAATEALAKNDFVAAGLAKQKELLNLALYREAADALEQIEQIRTHMQALRRKPAQERLGKAGSDYLEQVNALMERYEFSPIPLIDLQRRQSLREWIAEKEQTGETLGEEFAIPEAILLEARKMNYRELPYEELLGLRDTVKQIEHFAALKNRLLSKKKARDKAEAREELIAALEASLKDRGPQRFTESGMTRRERASKLARQFDASLLKTEQLVEWMDGGTTGPWHDYLWDPAVDAQAEENDYTKRITAKIAQAVVNVPIEIRRRMLDPVSIRGVEQPMNRKELLGVALNVGNQSNYTKLLKGMGWTPENVREMLDHLTQEEWQFVQHVWDTLESMWPDIAALQKKLTGIAPEKVPVTPVTTKFGEFKGGYYPIMYSAVLSEQGGLQLSSTFGKLLDNNYVRATLPSGYRKSRIEGFSRPFDLDVDRLPSHIAGVIKDLTHREWLMDANWITSDPKIRAVLQRRVGDETTVRLADWVKQVANDRNSSSTRSLAVWNRIVEHFRYNMVIVSMGFKASTLLSQMAGVAPAIEVIGGKDHDGVKWFAIGVTDALARPRSAYEFMTAQSGEMRHRLMTRDRDIQDKIRALQGREDVMAQVQEFSLRAIGYMELMVSMPAWIGAYKKAIAAGKDAEQAVRAGDRAVRLSQGAGGSKDLAAVASKSDQLTRLLTMFYTPFSALYGRLRAIGHDVEGGRDLPGMALRLFWTVVVAATIGELAAGHGPDKKKDEDWLTWWLRNVLTYPFLAVPGLRDVASAVTSGYGYQFTPLAQALKTTSDLARSTGKAIKGDKEWADLAEQSVKAFSYFVGLPTSQLLITGKYLHDLAVGKEHPDNLFQFAHDLLYVRPKEK